MLSPNPTLTGEKEVSTISIAANKKLLPEKHSVLAVYLS